MARLIWRDEALADIELIAEFIERDSAQYARRIVQRIRESTRHLVEFPRSGRIIPELGEENTREVIVGDYRVQYEVSDEMIEIVAVMHGARAFPGTSPND